MNTKRKLLYAGVAVVATAASLTMTGSAQAEPTGTPTFRALSGVGSDTTQDVLNGLSDVVTDASGVKLIGSYNAFGSATIQTKDSAACTGLNRPAGSGAGRTALVNSLRPGDPTAGCLDFARSSSINLAAQPAGQGLTYIPFATDAVSYAVTAGSDVPRNLTLDQIKSIYRCEVPTITPLLPQTGSGTRSFFLSTVGLTEAQIQGTCVTSTKANAPIPENDGRALTKANEIIPFSVAQYLSQLSGVTTDVRGSAVLGSINGVSPFALNTDFSVKRNVYNIVPTAKIGSEPTASVFVGPSSKVCQASATIKRYGFGTNASCGSTTDQTPTS